MTSASRASSCPPSDRRPLCGRNEKEINLVAPSDVRASASLAGAAIVAKFDVTVMAFGAAGCAGGPAGRL